MKNTRRLMERRGVIPYLWRGLYIFNELHPDRYIAVDLVMSDYEAAIQGSMSAAFHGSECIGCFFHYAQVHIFLFLFLFTCSLE
jgi:hypothetical protein